MINDDCEVERGFIGVVFHLDDLVLKWSPVAKKWFDGDATEMSTDQIVRMLKNRIKQLEESIDFVQNATERP